jgi:hypothetical protein
MIWPTREQWAKDRRTLFLDDDVHVSDRLSDYAAPEEVAALVVALRMRRMTYAVGSYERDGCNRCIRLVERDVVPHVLNDYCGAQDLTAQIRGRYEHARAQALLDAERDRAEVPIDDEAWQEELRWREVHRR